MERELEGPQGPEVEMVDNPSASFDKTQDKPEMKKEIGKKGVFSGVKDASRKFFRRKSI